MFMGNDRENRINQILSAALKCLLQKRLFRTTMDDIVVASKVKQDCFISLLWYW